MNVSHLQTIGDGGEQDQFFAKVARRIRKFGYGVFPNALPPEIGEALLLHVQALQPDEFVRAGIGRNKDHQENQFVRRDDISWIEGRNPVENLWLQWTSSLQQYLNKDLLLGLFSFESHFAHYSVGAFYKKHVDAFRGETNRVLSLIAYLNPGWLPDDGGELLLYSEEEETNEVIARVTPAFGTLVVFLSEEFPHEVLPAMRTRFSIAGWYRVNSSTALRVDPPA